MVNLKIWNTEMRVLVTGERGFIGKNLSVRLNDSEEFSTLSFTRDDSMEILSERINQSDAIVHLAGVNRPTSDLEFDTVNVGLTDFICQEIRAAGKNIPLILASSTQAKLDNSYGKSKRAAEVLVEELSSEIGNPVAVYQFPGVFGKWCKPNYNSVVATFCHNIANNLPIEINNSYTQLHLVYIDDVVNEIIRTLKQKSIGFIRPIVEPEYSIKLGELANQIENFKNSSNNLVSHHIGNDFTRALYSTYVSYLPSDNVSYQFNENFDEK